jgi:hypothetical protein
MSTTIAGGAVLLAVAAAAAASVVHAPALAIAAIGTVAFLVLAVVGAGWLPRAFLALLLPVLAGYACFGRSFAYLGAPPIFIGELVLLCGLAAVLFSGRLLEVTRQPPVLLLLPLVLWGATRTLPYIDVYRFDALRDAALWGYSVFAVVVAACLMASNGVGRLTAAYGRFAPWYVAWVPLALAISELLGERMPRLPGLPVAILTVKLGDMGVHLAGVGAFVLIHQVSRRQAGMPSMTAGRWAFWITWVAAVLCVLAKSRGGFVAVVIAMSLIVVLGPGRAGRRLLATAAFLLVLGGGTLLMLAGERRAPPDDSVGRRVTPAQMAANLLSLWRGDSDDTLSRTRQWRLEWWDAIVDYTFTGPYFWTGKGFGVNLADEDGFQVGSAGEAPLRSPHNGHLTMLARAGVPGLLLWVMFHLCFAATVGAAYVAARRRGAWEWARIDLWILAYWAAFVSNAAFDVFLEGPQGGIWFWCLIGLGVAAVQQQRAAMTFDRLRRQAMRRLPGPAAA